MKHMDRFIGELTNVNENIVKSTFYMLVEAQSNSFKGHSGGFWLHQISTQEVFRSLGTIVTFAKKFHISHPRQAVTI